jgi:16S rRNA (guanine966-N2)-methyltransferase
VTRIVAGRFGGRRLVTPRGEITRPTAEKVRAAIGDALIAGGGLAGAAVLDLYAGTGALGLELLSRGAASVVLVERDRTALAAIRANLGALGVAAAVTVVPADVSAFARLAGPAFDIVVADPPYGLPADELARVLADLHGAGRLRSGADILIERASRDGEPDWPAPLRAVRSRRYGDTAVHVGCLP